MVAPTVTDLCGRCGRELHGPAETEQCFFCCEAICLVCWEDFGYCPHPGADEWQARMKAAKTPEERAALFDELGPISDPKMKRLQH